MPAPERCRPSWTCPVAKVQKQPLATLWLLLHPDSFDTAGLCVGLSPREMQPREGSASRACGCRSSSWLDPGGSVLVPSAPESEGTCRAGPPGNSEQSLLPRARGSTLLLQCPLRSLLAGLRALAQISSGEMIVPWKSWASWLPPPCSSHSSLSPRNALPTFFLKNIFN